MASPETALRCHMFAPPGQLPQGSRDFDPTPDEAEVRQPRRSFGPGPSTERNLDNRECLELPFMGQCSQMSSTDVDVNWILEFTNNSHRPFGVTARWSKNTLHIFQSFPSSGPSPVRVVSYLHQSSSVALPRLACLIVVWNERLPMFAKVKPHMWSLFQVQKMYNLPNNQPY